MIKYKLARRIIMNFFMFLFVTVTVFGYGYIFTPTDAEEYLIDRVEHGNEWRRIHAAEGLITSGRQQKKISEIFLREYLRSQENSSWRVGCLRVLYQVLPTYRFLYRAEIGKIALCPSHEGAAHAVETMVKLKLRITAKEEEVFKQYAKNNDLLSSYALMSLAVNGDSDALAKLQDRMMTGDATATLGFFYIDHLPPKVVSKLVTVSETDDIDPVCRALVFRARAYHNCYTDNERKQLLRALDAEVNPIAIRIYLLTIGDFRDKGNQKLLISYWLSGNEIYQIAAASGILNAK